MDGHRTLHGGHVVALTEEPGSSRLPDISTVYSCGGLPKLAVGGAIWRKGFLVVA